MDECIKYQFNKQEVVSLCLCYTNAYTTRHGASVRIIRFMYTVNFIMADTNVFVDRPKLSSMEHHMPL